MPTRGAEAGLSVRATRASRFREATSRESRDNNETPSAATLPPDFAKVQDFHLVASSKDCCILEARYVSLSLYQLSTIP